MRSVLAVLVPVFVSVGGCGLVLDLDPPDPQKGGLDGGLLDGGRRDAPGPVEAGSADASVADAESFDAQAVEGGVVLPTCSEDEECQDGDPCNGSERCERGTCVDGSGCAAAMMCEAQRCTLARGCFYVPDDADGDGFAAGEVCGDCDDGDASRHMGAVERYDAKDNDCDGMVDEGIETAPCYADEDGDGYGDSERVTDRTTACAPTEAPIAGDCNDNDVEVFPGQMAFFSEPSTSGSGTSFDYDCDGTEEKRWPDLAPACKLVTIGRCAGGGWVGSVPDCGDSGTWQDCNGPIGMLLACVTATRTLTQECR